MGNRFMKLASSPLMNLDHTYRYSGTKLVEPESLSHHIVDTIMMGIKIIDELNQIIPHHLDESSFINKAVYHDLEEAITGDVPRPLKYHDETILTSLRGIADEVAQELFDREFHSGAYHYAVWGGAKNGREGYILKIVDMLVVANKVVKEVLLLNNNYMLRVAHEVSSYIEEQMQYLAQHPMLGDDGDTYLMNLMNDARVTMQEILNDHVSFTSKYNLYSQSMI